MKTQLLEDIGQSATLTLVPSAAGSAPKADIPVLDVAQATAATPVGPRAATGVWRQKPAGEPAVPATSPPERPPAPPQARAVFVPPAVEAAPDQPSPPLPEEITAPAEPVFSAPAMQSEAALQGPVFDFTTPSAAVPAPDLRSSEPGWFERSGQRYLLWGLYSVAGALFIQAGVWFYEERKDVAAPSLVAAESKVKPQAAKVAIHRITAAKEFTLGPGGEVRVTPPAPASSPSAVPRTAPGVPPLVLLEPEQAIGVKAELAQAPQRTSKPARAKVKHVPVHQVARAPVMPAQRKPEPGASREAMLKACRAHGYQAAQCVKRACSVTKYGFVCRG